VLSHSHSGINDSHDCTSSNDPWLSQRVAKDHVRFAYAWMYGVQARKDGKARDVPQYWDEYADAWLKGFDGEQTRPSLSAVSWKRNLTKLRSASRLRALGLVD